MEQKTTDEFANRIKSLEANCNEATQKLLEVNRWVPVANRKLDAIKGAESAVVEDVKMILARMAGNDELNQSMRSCIETLRHQVETLRQQIQPQRDVDHSDTSSLPARIEDLVFQMSEELRLLWEQQQQLVQSKSSTEFLSQQVFLLSIASEVKRPHIQLRIQAGAEILSQSVSEDLKSLVSERPALINIEVQSQIQARLDNLSQMASDELELLTGQQQDLVGVKNSLQDLAGEMRSIRSSANDKRDATTDLAEHVNEQPKEQFQVETSQMTPVIGTSSSTGATRSNMDSTIFWPPMAGPTLQSPEI